MAFFMSFNVSFCMYGFLKIAKSRRTIIRPLFQGRRDDSFGWKTERNVDGSEGESERRKRQDWRRPSSGEVESRGRSQSQLGDSRESYGRSRGPPRESYGRPSFNRGPPHESYAGPSFNRGPPRESYGRDFFNNREYIENKEPLIDPYEGDHIFGLMPVRAALSAGRRKIKELLVQEGMDVSNKKDELSAQSILDLAKEKEIPVREFSKHDLNMISDNRPHQGFILRASQIEDIEIDSLDTPDCFKCVLALDGEMNHFHFICMLLYHSVCCCITSSILYTL